MAAALGVEPVGFSDWPSRTLKAHLAEALAWIGQVAAKHAIDTFWVSAWEGGHQDHDTANFLAAKAAAGRPVFEFAEYGLSDGRRRWQSFARASGGETLVRLSPDEARAKRELLATYRSERSTLRAVRVARECFRPLPVHDYSRPPNSGALWRDHFHWVRFIVAHPSIDFEPSAEVYGTLAAFEASRPR